MDEAPSAQVQTDVRHLACNLEEQHVTDAQLVSSYSRCRGPKLPGCSGHAFADPGIGILHQPTAIESARATAAVTVRHADLIHCDSSCFLADTAVNCRRGARWLPDTMLTPGSTNTPMPAPTW